uniref:Lysine-rich coiled-coil protein 1 n=1 Tax=Moschus moschiferus TaxID=68415 RepID=A0A8C6DW66_MOSMO
MENSKTCDSFQHELQDYIRKQRARGLKPEVCFRKGTEDSAYRESDHTEPRPPVLEQGFPFRQPHKSCGSYRRPKTVESRSSPLSSSHHLTQGLESGEKEGGGHGGEEQAGWKRKNHEDGDSYKENRRKAKVEPGSAEKSKHRKKSTHDWDIRKERRRSSREKKHPGKHSAQEWDLWDEAILGGCY